MFSEIYHMLVGSSPQVIIAAIYVLLNYHLTYMLQLRDWTSFANRRQPPRVTDPEPGSDQISTYWLSLPYRYSISQLLSSVALGWFASQALFFYRLKVYDEDGNIYLYPAQRTQEVLIGYGYSLRNGEYSKFGLAYSPLGVICSITFGIIIFAVSLALGLAKCTPGLPLGSTNSFIIAAACHPPENDRHAARKLLQWGVVDTSITAREQPQHCTITSRRVESPVEGQRYA
ncbi:hypothetical protein EJ04DRAFT_489991 [Polyplosphaeria fusca]|uniref:Uncharacterized protein n=1 Tax=Polyplosphaeria fusca TaxID=682080 RepID=A0A9P4R454_9PLEO|nr:hypothetical protein EJ04DRAFT_489991 [Polyplosphaeria fusca]